MASLLAVRGLTLRFGGITALSDVSFDVPEGKITGLIGPNGAGKTTCFNCITRLYEPTSGEIVFKGHDLRRCAPHHIVRHRIARTFQNVALFDRMSVLENVLVGYHSRFASELGGPKSERAARAQAHGILEHLGLSDITDRPVLGLPFGTRKRVELARALSAQPELLLLDEPAGGLSHEDVLELGVTIKRVARDLCATILMIEHHMALVMGTSDRIIVLASGKKLADGVPEEIRHDPAVIDAYLGAA